MRRPVKNRIEVQPDVKYQSLLVARFINKIMQHGKKAVATRLVYDALDIAEGQLKKPAMEILDKAIENAAPTVELRSRRVGGANYQVPAEVRPERKLALAVRWIVESARAGKGKSMAVKLAEEIVNTYNNAGGAVKKKADVQRMAEANKAFAHFSW